MAFETFRIDNKLAPVCLSDLVHIYIYKEGSPKLENVYTEWQK
jgi:hypothetical protein